MLAVPPALRRADARAVGVHGSASSGSTSSSKAAGSATLEDARLRAAIRQAARDDLFVADPRRPPAANAAPRDPAARRLVGRRAPRARVRGRGRRARARERNAEGGAAAARPRARAGRRGGSGYPLLTAAMAPFGVALTGAELMATLGALCTLGGGGAPSADAVWPAVEAAAADAADAAADAAASASAADSAEPADAAAGLPSVASGSRGSTSSRRARAAAG